MQLEKTIKVRKPHDLEEGDPLELELLCSFNIREFFINFHFDTSGLQRVSLKELQDFAEKKSESITFFDSNGTCHISWANDKDLLHFEVSRAFSSTSFTVPPEGIMEEIIAQYKTFIKA